MTEMPKVALLGFDEATSAPWRWFPNNASFQIVAAADLRPHEAVSFAADLGVPLYPSLEAMVDAVQFETLIVTRPLEAAKQAISYALAHGIRVHCEAVPQTVAPRRYDVAMLGCDELGVASIETLQVHGSELVSIAPSGMKGVQELADEFGAFACESLEAMIKRGGFEALYVKLPPEATERAMEYAVSHGIRAICELEPDSGRGSQADARQGAQRTSEPISGHEPVRVRPIVPAELLAASVPAVTIKSTERSWEVHLLGHGEPGLASVLLVEIQPGQPAWALGTWSTASPESRGELLAEASRIIAVTERI